MQSQVSELRAQGLPGDAQQDGGPVLVAAGVLQDAGEQETIQLPQGLLVQVTRIGTKPLVDERFQIDASPLGRHRRGGLAGRLREFGEEVRKQDRAVGPQERRCAGGREWSA